MEGLDEAIRSQRNLRVHFVIALIVMVVSYFMEISSGEFLWLSFAVFSVIGMELINSLVEALMDAYKRDYDPVVKFVKDVAAGIVLWYSLFAVVVGLVVFGKSMFHWDFNVARILAIIYLVIFPTVSIIRRIVSSVKSKSKGSNRGRLGIHENGLKRHN